MNGRRLLLSVGFTSLFGFLLVSIGGSNAGCALSRPGSAESGDPCDKSADCKCSMFCQNVEDDASVCAPGCQLDSDCPGNGESGKRCGEYVQGDRQECVDGVCVPKCSWDRCGDECCQSSLATCVDDACCESGTVCGGKCCTNAYDSCCGDVCCDEACVPLGNDCSGEYCCGETTGDTVCVRSVCLESCSALNPCAEGCCVALEGGGGVCYPPNLCDVPCNSSACDSSCCFALLEGGGICVPDVFCD